MEKIISLFVRNYDGDRLVRDEVVPGAEWVIAGEGIATRKFDGACCRVKYGKLWKRYDAKAGKAPPEGFEAAQEPDQNTGHWPGWVLVRHGPEDKWFQEAWDNEFGFFGMLDGTYELCGPKVQGNPERFDTHVLVRHGEYDLPDAPRDFEGLKAWLSVARFEGIVWHHPDGRMVKIKAKDFGIKRISL